MYESYTAREFNSSLYRGIQAAEDTKTSFPSSPKTNFIRNSIPSLWFKSVEQFTIAETSQKNFNNYLSPNLMYF